MLEFLCKYEAMCEKALTGVLREGFDEKTKEKNFVKVSL
jgi:hypothetical protein